jgi:predicted transposase YbfD/YdcC
VLLSLPGRSAGGDGVVTDLLACFLDVPDCRAPRWVEHPLAAVLALCAGAVVAGMRSFTAVAGWIADVPADRLAQLYAGCGAGPTGPPSKATVWRVVTGVDAGPVDAAIGAWLLARAAREQVSDRAAFESESDAVSLTALAVDGKTVRGAKNHQGNRVHLLAAMTHDRGLVAAQTEVAAKTNEIPMFTTLLEQLDLTGLVITADALHTQRGTAVWLHRRGADFVFCVKENQPGLFTALDALPWKDVPIGHAATDRGHGRITRRTIQVLPAPDDLPFPHVNQVFLVERYVTDLHGRSLSNVAVLGVTSLTAHRADPPQLAQLVRGHWKIESLHWIRDVTYREDDSTAHTRSGPQVMAALRNLAIGAHRLTGRTDIAEATRWASRAIDRPFHILGLTSRS